MASTQTATQRVGSSGAAVEPPEMYGLLPHSAGSEDSCRLLRSSLVRLTEYCERLEFKGYEPFDGNASWLHLFTFGNLFAERVLLQVFLRCPWHIRPLFAVPRLPSAQGMGFFARGYLRLWQATQDVRYRERAMQCLDWLMQNPAPGYSGYCWGNLFYSASRGGPIPKYDPTIVWSSHIGQAFLDAYVVLEDARYLQVARGICLFILRDIPREATDRGTCIAYGPTFRESIHNSNMLGAALLARTGRLCGDQEMLSVSREAALYTCARQLPEGGWYYGEAPKYHWTDSWHTAYNLDSLKEYLEFSSDTSFAANLRRGFEFYRQCFFEESGRPRYYHDRLYLVDIQAAAQAIDTLAHFAEYSPHALPLAEKVAAWTIRHMQSPTGFFYYRDLGWKKVKVPMMHWGQSTMFSGLANLLQRVTTARTHAGAAAHT